jgi:glycosyltransferase involved in cell wall biosynthesis
VLNIAYVTTYDSSNIRMWSGTGFHIAKSLESAGAAIHRIGALRATRTLGNGVAYLWATRVRGQQDHAHRHPSVLRGYARQVQRGLRDLKDRGIQIDMILAPGVLPIAHLETDTPIAIWTDCTFASMVGYYQSWTNLSLRSLKMGNNADRMGLRRAAKLVFASEWAAKSAIEDYGCDPARISIVPLGANVDAGISEDDALSLIEQRLEPTVRLLLVGVDWQRKGCSFAIEVAQQLRQRAVNVKLDIVGCLPPPGYEVPDFVTCHGFLRKSCPEDVARLRRLFLHATLLILPTKAECQGIVFNEAAAHGLPVIAPDTGGGVICSSTRGHRISHEARCIAPRVGKRDRVHL